ncbi:hypothetical protein [Micromonospora endophytica]|uniref:Uncharacterized protein n=1 Tax=Micromonospora endophytica TaxID=515350 RepID=A0A2W2DBW0_9ACTN|nr:hypothetical protein [Micromonospora endophytica]PZF97327.1 hypothetical protein C1I93_12115 [Micromonospora endophytica]
MTDVTVGTGVGPPATGSTEGTTGPAEGTRGPAAGAVPRGGGMTTGPIEGVGMNGVLPSGSAVLPTVAEPVLIAARTGIEAVPASSATVSR